MNKSFQSYDFQLLKVNYIFSLFCQSKQKDEKKRKITDTKTVPGFEQETFGFIDENVHTTLLNN